MGTPRIARAWRGAHLRESPSHFPPNRHKSLWHITLQAGETDGSGLRRQAFTACKSGHRGEVSFFTGNRTAPSSSTTRPLIATVLVQAAFHHDQRRPITMTIAPGARFDRYEILSQLGKG